MNKRAEGPDEPHLDDDVELEYEFQSGIRGKYASRYSEHTNVVVIDPDISEIFPTAADVNRALRKLLTMDQTESSSER